MVLEADIFDNDTPANVLHSVDYSYDAFDRLVRRREDADGAGSAAATDQFFSWEQGQIALQFDGPAASDLSHRYLWNPAAVDQLLADEQLPSLAAGQSRTADDWSGTVLWTLADHLGSIRDVVTHDSTTHATTLVNHRLYDSFGNLLSQTNPSFSIAFGYAAGLTDTTTSLTYFRHRWLDPQTGRWMSEDPIGFAGGDSNVQRYVRNSPVGRTDPTGLVDPNHGDFLNFLNNWGAGSYLDIHHIFRQQFYDNDPELGPYLTGHCFGKDDTRNLIPLPNQNAFSSGYSGNRAAHLGRHTGASTNLLLENILRIKRREDAAEITADQAKSLLAELQSEERMRLRTTPDALQTGRAVQQCQSAVAQPRPSGFARRPKGILRLPTFQVPRMPNIRLPQALNGPVAREYGPLIALSLGEALLSDIDENYLDGKMVGWMNANVNDPTYPTLDYLNWTLGGDPRYFRDGHFDRALNSFDIEKWLNEHVKDVGR